MGALTALLFIFIVYTIGDIVAAATKSIVPSLFVCSAIFLGAFWLGLPNTLFEDSLLYSIGAILITSLLVHMGSMINLNELKAQWKTVLISFGGILGVVILLLLVARPIVGKETAIIAAPPVSGGLIAGLQMGDEAAKIGRDDLQLMATLLVVLQGFIGYPLASLCLRKEATSILARLDMGDSFKKEEKVEINDKDTIFKLDDKYRSNNYYLAKTILIALIATKISQLLKNVDTGIFIVNALVRIDKNVLALLLGIIFAEAGVIEREPLSKANSFGFAMGALMSVIYASLAGATPSDLLEILLPILICLVLGTIGIGVVSIIVGKILKLSPWISFAIGSCALFGFPGTYIVSKEVCEAVGRSDEEKEIILSETMPKMLVSGFVTVSIGSVVLAGILAPMIAPA